MGQVLLAPTGSTLHTAIIAVRHIRTGPCQFSHSTFACDRAASTVHPCRLSIHYHTFREYRLVKERPVSRPRPRPTLKLYYFSWKALFLTGYILLYKAIIRSTVSWGSYPDSTKHLPVLGWYCSSDCRVCHCNRIGFWWLTSLAWLKALVHCLARVMLVLALSYYNELNL